MKKWVIAGTAAGVAAGCVVFPDHVDKFIDYTKTEFHKGQEDAIHPTTVEWYHDEEPRDIIYVVDETGYNIPDEHTTTIFRLLGNLFSMTSHEIHRRYGTEKDSKKD